MLGIDDPGIYLGYLLAILGLLACVVYGMINWNKGRETDIDEIQKDLDWESKEEQTNI
uniref:symporter small accessory protein n=1 Tax=uncultured Draconibacterium sp. TaxID=1573823 RepID=UPI0032169669